MHCASILDMGRDVFVVSAVRTPIGKFGGALAGMTAPDMGVHVAREAVRRAFDELPPERIPGEGARIAPKNAKQPWHIDEVVFGNARPAGVGPNPARQIAWRAGLGDDVPAFTVNMACASGLRAILLGWQQIQLGAAEIVLAGGAESMSRVPYLVDARWGMRLGNQPLVDAMYRDGFNCPMAKMVMGETAEILAGKYAISREEQDEFAVESHRRAAAASSECKFGAEISAVEVTDKRGKITRIEKDEHVRPDATLAGMAKLPPVFSQSGTITAGNSSGITDGAAALVLVSESKVRDLDLRPLARIHAGAIAAVDPKLMGIGPVPAIRMLEEKSGWTLGDYAAIELNEAFAAQVIACDRELHFDRARLNPNGGAIALGHPIGATGARIATTLIHHLRKLPSPAGRRGLAALCVSGGMGVALALEAV